MPRTTASCSEPGSSATWQGFTSAIVLGIIALLIGYEALQRFFEPVAIGFSEAIPIAVVGLAVNIASAWLLSGTEHPGHSHGGGHGHGDAHSHGGRHSHDEGRSYSNMPSLGAANSHSNILNPATHHHHEHGAHSHAAPTSATTRDNSIRSAYAHVLADAFVSVLAITGLILAKVYGWLWMDPLAGIIGAVVIANWSITLIRDTGGILLDVCPDEVTREKLRRTIEIDGDRVVDLHLWRLGPGHLAAVLAIATSKPRDATFYRGRLSSFACLSHITVEVTRAGGL